MALPLNRRSIGQVCRWLAVALLVAQFGAEIHLYSHPLADASDRLGAARQCSACLASSQLQHAVATPPPMLPSRNVAWMAVVPEVIRCEMRSATFRAFRSRAPPPLV